MALLTFEDGLITLGGQELPGLLDSLSVSGSFKSDSKEHDQLSGSVRTPLGWNDADISIVLKLTTDETGKNCYQKLKVLEKIFKKTDAKSNNEVYDVVNQHMQARSIRRVTFEKLKSSETNKDDVLMANLEFKEFIPQIVQTEQNASLDSGNAAPPINTIVKDDPTIQAGVSE